MKYYSSPIYFSYRTGKSDINIDIKKMMMLTTIKRKNTKCLTYHVTTNMDLFHQKQQILNKKKVSTGKPKETRMTTTHLHSSEQVIDEHISKTTVGRNIVSQGTQIKASEMMKIDNINRTFTDDQLPYCSIVSINGFYLDAGSWEK